ncbi:COG4223 family protein [Yoonia sediminilitoris]|uniref:COG4223 family protein n=1 Tax=Yoonia sediminilitoris TaxID=1286148 RepID=UPI001FE3DE2F|nr:mitofilin family membrane protein [Yoonia sediminilitoris]
MVDPIPPEVHHVPEAAKGAAEAPAQPSAAKSVPEKEAQDTPKSTASAKPAPKPKAAPATPAPAPAPERKGGFFPLLLGGLVAGGIGYAVATYVPMQPDTTLADSIAEQGASISAIREQIAELPTVDLSEVEAKIASTQETLSDNLANIRDELADIRDELDSGLAALDARIAELETLPAGEGSVADRAAAAFEAELENLRAEMEELTGAAQTQLDAARQEAASIEENAAAAARAAAGRAALARVRLALDNGEPLGAALNDLEAAIGETAPDALLAAQDGVPTLVSLQDGFDDVANEALAAARSANVAGEETSGLGAFLRNQLDVRSTTPQEGSSVDAILSRAEASVKAGRLADALAEISALPEDARAAMTDWLDRAETRAAAVAAVDVLISSLNDS